MKPSVKHLDLLGHCLTKHFQIALEAGTASVNDLCVDIQGGDDDDVLSEKPGLLASFIRRAVQLNRLSIHYLSSRTNRPLFQAIEACATVTEVEMHCSWKGAKIYHPATDCFPHERQHLDRITTRNEELHRFVANPGIYPVNKILPLMRGFDHCPTGLYMLARRLPEIFSFSTGENLFQAAEPNRKKRRIMSDQLITMFFVAQQK